MDKLYRWTVPSLLEVNIFIGRWVRIVLDAYSTVRYLSRLLWCCRLISSSTQEKYRKGCRRDSSRQLVRIKGTKVRRYEGTWLRSTWTMMNDYGYNLDRLQIDSLHNIIIVCFFCLIFINDTLSDIGLKGEFDVLICCYISLINIFISSYERSFWSFVID